MTRAKRFAHLSTAFQSLTRLCQSIDYGQILDLQVRDHEPAFDPPPTVVLDIKLDSDCSERAESELADFDLRDEVCRLLDRIEEMQAGVIQRIEVRAGIPRRILIEAKLTEVVR